MYNSITEEKIKQIPQIGDIDIDRLPQELTRIYAQIVSLRHQFTNNVINYQSEELMQGFQILQTLANNLETILLTFPQHERKESIAFVAGTATILIHKIGLFEKNKVFSQTFEIDSISSYVSAIILFLIGNSQADASEIAMHLYASEDLNITKTRLTNYVKALARGDLKYILSNKFDEEEIDEKNQQEAALDYLWRALGLGIFNIAERLTGKPVKENASILFDQVIDLSVSVDKYFNQKSIFSGPYHLAKLLKVLEKDILKRGIISIPPPTGIGHIKWRNFLEKLALERPYLWENHKNAVETNFLNPGISAVLTLPTGSGKSTLSELKIASCLISEKRVIYLVPTHALEDQVNKNLRRLFKEFQPEQNEFDGEYTELVDIGTSLIIVMTPERCLTLLNMNPDLFQSVGLVAFDEFHLIHGNDIRKDRRSVDAMYCLISLFTLIPQADYLLISAMVENGNEIKEWIQKITNRECHLFNSSWKPTRQLHGCLVFEEKEILILNESIRKERLQRKTIAPSGKLKESMLTSPHCFFSLRNIWETNVYSDYYRTQILDGKILLGINNRWGLTTNRNDIAARLGIHFSKLGFKTLIFVGDPRIAETTSQKIIRGLNDHPNKYIEFYSQNSIEIDSLALELGNIEHSYFHNHDNVGIHHGLLLPTERSLIEKYFKYSDGSIILVATATLAQGINLPAEIVIIAGDDRFDEDSNNRVRVPPHELLNAAGRAGRAGQSSLGAVILIPGEIITIQESTISDRWWNLKNEVFSKSDQCLTIEDPLGYFLDSLQVDSEILDTTQTNILYKFKAGNLSENETTKLLNNSLYAYKAIKENRKEEFRALVNELLKRRNELDSLSEDIIWTKEISFKTGIDPTLVLDLSNAIEQENFEEFINFTVIEFIDWFFTWLQKDDNYLYKIYTKQSTISQIKRATGLKPDMEMDIGEILGQLPVLSNILKHFVKGYSLEEINIIIPDSTKPEKSPYLIKARNFVIRLVPEISFSFGLLSMIIVEKAKQKGIMKSELPWTIKALASCIREGFDNVNKLFYKRKNQILTRVETHNKINKN